MMGCSEPRRHCLNFVISLKNLQLAHGRDAGPGSRRTAQRGFHAVAKVLARNDLRLI
jgi:hypothetical protein